MRRKMEMMSGSGRRMGMINVKMKFRNGRR